MKRFFLGVISPLFALFAGTSLGAAEERPHIVFIMADDLGYGEVGYQGQEKIRTPHIDRMAREGLQFRQHYSGAPVCAPARCVLMTGLHTGHAYVRGNKGRPIVGQLPIPDETVTMAELLQRAGYRTGGVGKWGLGGPGTEGVPHEQGFDFWYGYLDQWRAHYYYPDYLYRNGVKESLEGNNGKTGKTYSHDLMTNEALEFIDRTKEDQPFFLYIAYTIPHVSLQVPEDSLEEYRGKWEETAFPGRHYTGHETPRAAYAAMITRMDRDIGRILDRLEERGLTEETLVVFTSDNGPTYAGGVDYEFFQSAGPLRGLKGSLWEGGIRVPTVARWPGKIEPGSKTDHISAFQDWLPTFTQLANTEPPAGLDGHSLVPTLLSEGEQTRHDYLYWEHGNRKQAIRLGKWKAFRQHPEAPIQLYHLGLDLAETKNVALDHPDVVKRVAEIMRSARTDSEHFPLRAPEPIQKPSTEGALPKNDWKVVRVSSESSFNGKTAAMAIDGDPSTWWHSQWRDSQPSHPHELVIDLGAKYSIEGVRYLPRQDGGLNGTIKAFEMYVSDDPKNFGPPVHTGEFSRAKREQETRFEAAKTGRYFLLRTRSAHDDQPFASIGELGLIGRKP